MIDGMKKASVMPGVLPRREVQPAVLDVDVHAGRRHVDVPRLDHHTVESFPHGKGRLVLEQRRHHARVLRREMRDEDECRVHVRRQGCEQLRERFEAAGRRTACDQCGAPITGARLPRAGSRLPGSSIDGIRRRTLTGSLSPHASRLRHFFSV